MKKIIALVWGICSMVAVGAQPYASHCIIIEEIFPDPSPSVGLPEFEFIELLNRSDSTIDLKNWSVGDLTSRTQIPFSVLLAPDSVLILCSQSAAQVYSRLGKTVGLQGFPSLNKQSDHLVLYAPDGRVIHALQYDQSWYHNAVKSSGGWSLEMINPLHPCVGIDNWEASNDASGGTPGRLNSPHAFFQDQAGPRLVRAYLQDSVTLLLEFDEPLDSIAAITRARYTCYPQLELQMISPSPPFFKVLIITLSKAADPEKIYQLRISDLVDCSGNRFDENEMIRVGLPAPPEPGSLVINEVLFNPPPDGYDYLELYNRGKSPVNLEQLRLANRSLSSWNNIVSPIEKPTLLFPGEYAVLTENKSWLLPKYRLTPAAAVFEVKKLPALPDDKGVIAILNYDGR
ncbi:MAG: lamin tail domain-containing protein, partial [Chitinophagaceae bacterium]